MNTHWLDLDTMKLYFKHINAVRMYNKGHRIAVFDDKCKWVLSWVPIKTKIK